jgi:hypothetical protein
MGNSELIRSMNLGTKIPASWPEVAGHVALAVVTLLLISICTACGGARSIPPPIQQFNFFRIVDAVGNPTTVQYAYAPSIVLQNNVYHVFFCSGGNIFPAWDYIRYVNSIDGGQTWSSPIDMLHATAFNGMDLGACDPSVVFFQGFYYMFYGAAITTAPNVFQTVIQVARANAVTGPYLTYTQRGTWDNTPTDPQIIVKPFSTRLQQPSGYGAGQPSVVVLNGKLLMWYTDDSLYVTQNGDFEPFHLYMLQSSDPVTWTPDPNQQTNIVGQDSPDIKYDPVHNQFVATWVGNMFTPQANLVRAFSSDGLTWSSTQTVISARSFLPFTNNAGATADETGHLLPSQTIVGFGRPYSQAGIDAGRFDLFGVSLDAP